MENLGSLIKPPRFQGAAMPAPWLVRDLSSDLYGFVRVYFAYIPMFPLARSTPTDPEMAEVYTGLRRDVDSISPAD